MTWLLSHDECDADTELLSFFREVAFISGFKMFTNGNYEKQEMDVDKTEIRKVC